MAELTTPVGRIVHGNPSTRFDQTDDNGKPKLNPDGSKKTSISFGLAIQKQGEQHWNQTPWGAVIWQTGLDGWGAMTERHDFAWKITDGDSNIPNKKNNKPCDKEGYPNHWVINFSTMLDVKLYDYIQSQGNEIFEAGVIKTGHFVQVYCTIEPNNKNNPTVQSAGVYINPVYVAHCAFGQEIQTSSGPALSEVGFGGAALPQGASTTPQNGFNQQPASPQQQGGYAQPQQGGYAQPQQQGGYAQPQGPAGNGQPPQQGGYQQPQGPAGNGQQPQQQGGYQQPQQGGYQQNPNGVQHAPEQNAAPYANQQQQNVQGASSAPQGYGQPNHQFSQGPQQ